MEAVCINRGNADTLEAGKKYFIFKHGPKNVYVSRFNNEGAHFGSYPADLFEPVEVIKTAAAEEWPQEPEEATEGHGLETDKKYIGRLIWRRPGYKNVPLQQYRIIPHRKRTVFFFSLENDMFRGCFPIHWFDDITEYTEAAEVIEVIQSNEVDPLEWEEFKQTTIFDFLES